MGNKKLQQLRPRLLRLIKKNSFAKKLFAALALAALGVWRFAPSREMLSAHLSISLTLLSLFLFRMGGTPDCCHRCVFFMLFLLSYAYNITYFAINAMTGGGIDASFFYHLEQGTDGGSMEQFQGIVLAAAVALLVGMALAWATLRHFPKKHLQAPIFKMISLTAIVLAFAINPFSSALYQHYLPSLGSLDLGTIGYTPPVNQTVMSAAFQNSYRNPREEISNFRPNKNIVHIFLESVERNYFDQKEYPGVAPRLIKWEEQAVSFSNITDSQDTEWTVAGMVASLCGIPLVTTGGTGNSLHGMNHFLPGVTCLGDLLKEAGYHQSFIGGADAAFAGKGRFLKSHGIDDLLGLQQIQQIIPNATTNSWGIYDDDLLDVAFEKYKKLSADTKPFALYTLTMDTHGVTPSPGCVKDKVVHNDKTYIDSARCTDYVVDRFIRRVLDEDSKCGNNTIIIVSTDHLAMGYANPEKLQRVGPRRDIFFVLGNNRSETHNVLGTKLDIPATVLSFLGYPEKAFGFGRDLTTRDSLMIQDPNFGSTMVTKMGAEMRKEFWMMPGVGGGTTLEVNTTSKKLRLGDRVFSIPILISANSKDVTEEILQYDPMDPIPIAFRPHSGTTSITVDKCKYFDAGFATMMPTYCLFVNDSSNSSGWLLPLHQSYVSFKLNTILHKTASPVGFITGSISDETGTTRHLFNKRMKYKKMVRIILGSLFGVLILSSLIVRAILIVRKKNRNIDGRRIDVETTNEKLIDSPYHYSCVQLRKR